MFFKNIMYITKTVNDRQFGSNTSDDLSHLGAEGIPVCYDRRSGALYANLVGQSLV